MCETGGEEASPRPPPPPLPPTPTKPQGVERLPHNSIEEVPLGKAGLSAYNYSFPTFVHTLKGHLGLFSRTTVKVVKL